MLGLRIICSGDNLKSGDYHYQNASIHQNTAAVCDPELRSIWSPN